MRGWGGGGSYTLWWRDVRTINVEKWKTTRGKGGKKNMHLRLSPKKIKVEKKRNGVCGDQKANKWRR